MVVPKTDLKVVLFYFSRPGFTRVIPGEGMPHVDAAEKQQQRGDLVVEFDIEFPKSLSAESKDLVKRALIPGANKKDDASKAKKKQDITLKSSDFED